MVDEAEAGQVTLRVEFSGLCLYMIGDPDVDAADPNARNRGWAREFAVLMPDARKRQDPIHGDGTPGEAHVGYVRFDLANLDLALGVDPGVVEDDVGRPRNEIIHRLDGEELDFGLGRGPVDYDLAIPSFNKFANSLTPVAGLLSGPTPSNLLMRTFLNEGEIRATGSGKIWTFSPVLSATGAPYANQFGGYAVWNRQLDSDNLTVTIRKFDGSGVTAIPLVARDVRSLDGRVRRLITIKISNLCAHNPLEWRDDYPTRTVGAQDKDFKWLYRLLQAPAGPGGYAGLLGGRELPFPTQISLQAFGDEDCMGGSFTF